MNLIFDFDGTLVDSFDKVIQIFNILAEKYKFRKISEEEIPSLKNLNSTEIIKYLKVPLYKIPNVLLKERQQLHSVIHTLSPFKNLPETIQVLYARNFSLGIMSSNSVSNIKKWLDLYSLSQFFKFIESESSYFGKHRILKKIIKKYGINPTKTFYIGDETRDIEAAKQTNINSIAVTWGFNSEQILYQHKPDFLVKKPEDLLAILGQPN